MSPCRRRQPEEMVAFVDSSNVSPKFNLLGFKQTGHGAEISYTESLDKEYSERRFL